MAQQQQVTVLDQLMALAGSLKRQLLQIQQQTKEGAAQAPKGARQAQKKKKRALHERAVAVAQSGPGLAVLGAAAAYATVRGGIEGFHLLRRRFLRGLLLDVCAALDALGQTWWIDFGCLLGIHRDGDLIAHDNDVDLAVFNPDWPALLKGLKQHLPPNKYSLKVVMPEGQPQSSWIRVYCPLGMADLFGAYSSGSAEGDEGHGSEVYVDNGHGDTMHIARDLVLPTRRSPWRGVNLSVPAEVEGTLARRYGPNWRTPAYAEKGADTVEGSKPYMRLFRALARIGIRI